MSFRVLITSQAPHVSFSSLRDTARLHFADDPNELMPREQVISLIRQADAMINQGDFRVDPELLEAAPKLRIVTNVAIGTDKLDPEAITKRGVWGCNAPYALTDTTAECAIALMLAVTRKVVTSDQ